MVEAVNERHQLADTWLAFAQWHVSRGNYVDAIEASDEIRGLISPTWDHFPDLLVLMARCITLAETDPKLGAGQARLRGREYSDRLLALIDKAEKQSRTDLSRALQSPAFEPLRSKLDFKQVVRGVSSKVIGFSSKSSLT